MKSVMVRFLADEHGATAIEYGLLAALIAVAAIAAFTTLGNGLVALFGRSETGVGNVVAGAVNNLN
jgi:pilus assembly protein Flp/PilA